MKNYMIKISIFLLPILAIAIFLEVYIRNQPNDYSYKNEYLTAHAKDINTLVFGSSHSFYGIDPQYFTKNTFNAAHVAQSLKWDYFIFDKFQNKMTNLEYVIMPISYFSLFYELEGGDADWRIKDYAIYYDAKESSFKYNFEVLNRKLVPLFLKFYKSFTGEDKGINCSTKGFGNRTALMDVDIVTSGKTAAKIHTVENYDSFAGNLEILEKFISDCKEKNVKVLLIIPPAWKTYKEHLNAIQMKKTIAACFDLSGKFDNVTFISLFDDRRFNIDDFANADHLNDRGAEKISRILDRIIMGN